MRHRGWLLLLLGACAREDEPVERQALALQPPPEEPLRFGWPLATQEGILAPAIGVDHDPVAQEGLLAQVVCTAYNGEAFPYCYDQHDGSDFLLEGGFEAMDAGSVDVLAAAPGVVLEIEESQYDRCHVEGTGISCDGFPILGNYVKLAHPDGSETWYWHLMTDSVVVEVGDEVDCGAVLGKVGSSGLSSGPHLHFEVHDPNGEVVDPYAGPSNPVDSLWAEQRGEDELPGWGCTAP